MPAKDAGAAATHLESMFVAQSSRPEGLLDLDLNELTPFQRGLLFVDGTVTQFLEAYMLEIVDVVRLRQRLTTAREDQKWLEAPAGTETVSREVLLQGRMSAARYAYARSLIVPERLPAGMANGLDAEDGGLGRLLLSSRIECLREMLWCGRRTGDIPAELGWDEAISRTYRIILDKRPIIMIEELFPFDQPEGERFQ